MTTGLRAIETHYKGYRFRSRLEARWAVFMDELHVAWDYEKEGYDLGDSGYYLPDFWLPDTKVWIEIKGERPTETEMAKATALAEASENSVHVFYGKVAHDPFWTFSESENEGKWGGLTFHPACACGHLKKGLYARWSSWNICHACGTPYVSDSSIGCVCRKWHHCSEDERQSKSRNRCYLDEYGRRRRCQHDGILDIAYAAARGARFEFGESGAPR